MMRYAITNAQGAFLTQMGWMQSKDYALKFPTAAEAQSHMEANRKICAGGSVRQVDDPDQGPVRTAGIATEYDPWGFGNV